MDAVYAIGYTTKLVPNWSSLVPPLKAPSNYGADAAAKYIATKQESQKEEARWNPLTARLHATCVLQLRDRGQWEEKKELSPGMLTYADRIYTVRPMVFTRMLMDKCLLEDGVLTHSWAYRFEGSGLRVRPGAKNVVVMDPLRALTGESTEDLAVKAALQRYEIVTGPCRSLFEKTLAMIESLQTSPTALVQAEVAAHCVSYFAALLES